MAAATLAPTARPRRSRTRTKSVSAREALAVSTLKPNQYDLLPGTESLVCPDCTTWVPITGIQAKVHKLVPHHAGPAGRAEPIRCSGSNRRVIVDVKVAQWARRLENGVAETDGRRSNRVAPKPKTATAPAVTQIQAQSLDAEDALTAYREHLKTCRISKAADRCGGTRRCGDGIRLAVLYEQLKRTQPHRDREARVDALLARYRAATAPAKRTCQWTSTAASVRRADLQRVHDQLEAVKLQYGPNLDRFEQADLNSAIKELKRRLRRLS